MVCFTQRVWVDSQQAEFRERQSLRAGVSSRGFSGEVELEPVLKDGEE